MSFKFTEDWFSQNEATWKKIFDHYGDTTKRVLEIGAYEGKATVWLCQNIPSIKEYMVIDTFEGSEAEDGMEGTYSRLREDKNFIEKNFKHNIKTFSNRIDFTIHKGLSQKVLPTIKSATVGEYSTKFDFIYVDGSHRGDDTFIDGYWSHRLLNIGGVIIFDDYGWKDPNRPRKVESPELGIRMWYSAYVDRYEPILKGYQAGFERIK